MIAENLKGPVIGRSLESLCDFRREQIDLCKVVARKVDPQELVVTELTQINAGEFDRSVISYRII